MSQDKKDRVGFTRRTFLGAGAVAGAAGVGYASGLFRTVADVRAETDEVSGGAPAAEPGAEPAAGPEAAAEGSGSRTG